MRKGKKREVKQTAQDHGASEQQSSEFWFSVLCTISFANKIPQMPLFIAMTLKAIRAWESQEVGRRGSGAKTQIV